jgi:hypothetical protein
MAADAVRAGDLGELVFATWRFGCEASLQLALIHDCTGMG